jgi:hypothetical protein
MVNWLNVVNNSMYFLSSFGCFPGVMFYTYIGFSAINIDDYIDSTNKNSKIF